MNYKKVIISSVGILSGIILSGCINNATLSALPYVSGKVQLFNITPDYYSGIDGLQNKDLILRLNNIISNHKPYGYSEAKYLIFTKLDNLNGFVEDIYAGKKLQTNTVPSDTVMNIEHVWPQSKFGLSGGLKEVAKADFHHLFPADSKINGIRGNNPFDNLPNGQLLPGGSKTTKTAFEPRDVSKGEVARAIFYFSVRYNKPVDIKEETVLKNWNSQDPVSASEKERNEKIFNFQQNRNPFIDKPDLIGKISDF